ncbi:MAG: glutathione synthase, partial [Gammaproteobacteria bacterium]
MKLGVIMDPITGINIKKDSTFAMLLAAQRRNWDLYYMEVSDLHLEDDKPCARMRLLNVVDDPERWFTLHEDGTFPLAKLDTILMRKDPPFNMEYIYVTYMLELAEQAGVLVVNKPGSLRDAN